MGSCSEVQSRCVLLLAVVCLLWVHGSCCQCKPSCGGGCQHMWRLPCGCMPSAVRMGYNFCVAGLVPSHLYKATLHIASLPMQPTSHLAAQMRVHLVVLHGCRLQGGGEEVASKPTLQRHLVI